MNPRISVLQMEAEILLSAAWIARAKGADIDMILELERLRASLLAEAEELQNADKNDDDHDQQHDS